AADPHPRVPLSAHEIRVRFGGVAPVEEGRPGAGGHECVQQRRQRLRRRPIVEGEGDVPPNRLLTGLDRGGSTFVAHIPRFADDRPWCGAVTFAYGVWLSLHVISRGQRGGRQGHDV